MRESIQIERTEVTKTPGWKVACDCCGESVEVERHGDYPPKMPSTWGGLIYCTQGGGWDGLDFCPKCLPGAIERVKAK